MKIDSSVNITGNSKANNISHDMATKNPDFTKIQSKDGAVDKDPSKKSVQGLSVEIHPTEDIMQKSIKQANERLADVHKYMERDVHEVTKTVIYKLVDSNTKEVIREFPPEKIQDMIAKMWELAGLFVDEKA